MSNIAQVITGELFGTFMLVLLGNCVVANVLLKGSKGENSGWIVVSVGWGLAVAFAAMLSTISCAHLNPAVTIGLWVAGKKAAFVGQNYAFIPIYILFQFIGAMLGQIFVYLTYFKQYQATKASDKILATFSTSPAHRSYFWNTITEMIATFVLLMIIAGTMSIKNLMNSNPAAAFMTGSATAGLGVMIICLALGGPTGIAINPARDLGPRIIHAFLPIANKGSSDWKYAAVPVAGPLLGAILAGSFIQLLAVL